MPVRECKVIEVTVYYMRLRRRKYMAWFWGEEQSMSTPYLKIVSFSLGGATGTNAQCRTSHEDRTRNMYEVVRIADIGARKKEGRQSYVQQISDSVSN